uniref:Dyp-type peroxidase n=1 Tax=Ningiella ruwaisensis TaxID=2364274 RepID=UPI0010A05AC8|nr:Dyp-type peroxidase [Ningiella ruwaisensis]
MTQAQKGICAEPNLHAQYLLFNVVDDDMQAIRSKLATCLDIFDHFDEEHYEAMVSGVVAIGTNFWSELYPEDAPSALSPFPDMQSEDRCAPVIPCDLFVQIRADRLDICHAIGIEIMDCLRLHTELVEQIRAFRYLDGRDLTGFVITEDNPRGMKKFAIATVGDEDLAFKGGSYVHVQRYRHDMTRWQALSEKRQEGIIGRTKEHNLPVIDSGLSSHAFRTKITGANGEYPIFLNQSMPYGNMSVQGLYFVSCANHPNAFKNLLHSRIYGDQNGHYDKLLDYTNAETGAAFFAPSIAFVRSQALL